MNVCAKILILSCVFGLSLTVRHHFNSLETAKAGQMIEDGLSQCPVTSVCFPVLLTDVGLVIWRPEITTEGQGRVGQGQQLIIRIAICGFLSTARGVRNDLQLTTGVHVSNQTVRNRLHDDRLDARRPATGPFLTIAYRANRRMFAQDNIGWQLDQWRTVLFTDESRFHVCTCDRCVRVWRRVGERYID